MTFSKFEKYAAGKLNNHTSIVDAEELWNDILPHVRKDNNRRKGLIWFLFVGLIAAFAAIYTFTDGNASDSNQENTTFSSAGAIIEGNKTSQPVGKENIAAQITTSEQSEITEQSAHNSETSIILNTSSNEVQVLPSVKPQNKIKTTKSVPLIIEENNNEVEKAEKEPIAIIEEEIDEVNDIKDINTPEVIPTEIVLIETELENAEPETSLVEEEETPQKLDGMVSGFENGKKLAPRRSPLLDIRFGVGVYGGFSSSFSSLKDKDGTNPEYLQLRLGTEEQLETIQMGVDVMAKSKLGVYLKTGVQYSRIARKFNLTSDLVTIDTVHGIQRIYVNNNTNDTIYEYGPIPVTTTTSYNKVTYNYFHLMDIPLLVGYTYNHENWSFGAEAGAIFNLSVKTKGEIFADSQTEFYNMTDDPSGWFKESVGVSFTASINAAYHLNDNFQIYLAPTARLESVFSTDANPIEQKHGALGVNIGARYFIGY